MEPYTDYDFYINVYRGNAVEEEDFPRLYMRASEYVFGMTRGLVARVPEQHMEPVRMCVCAISEIIQDEERLSAQSFSGEKPVSSESVGSHSISYSSPAMSGAESEYIGSRKREALFLYLSTVPLLSGLFGVRSYKCTHRTR